MAQESHFITTADGKIHYQTIGEGPSLLIINGGPGFSSEGFMSLGKSIAAMGYSSILFDQRGTGQSTLNHVDGTTLTMDLMVEDMERIRTDLNLKQWIVLGHSFGGMLANYYTSKYPENVVALIHSSSGGLDLALLDNVQANLHAKLTQQKRDSLVYWRQKMRAENSITNREQYYNILASTYVYNKAHIPQVSQRLMQGNMTINQLVWNDMHRIEYDCKDALKAFNKPVLILQGKQDVLSASVANTAKDVFSNATLYFLDECGHYGWLDQKDKYYTYIQTFLDGLD
ncbi:MAG: alpha/beta fold hydrolase [Winogradskyella sp.]|nr:alpha/beta hydrolase [Winogradskyella sp.]MBT8376492.1 alpha/beta hydrolase [Bacteroidia bacterium]NNC46121.1 alpha/beta fold hydrolase [Winogradskyella sp.]NNF85564.1 alpha/beta fold hydrolase [Winogradskyella sp.]NNL82823.1 alpha/beta fold hydrolase [Winogradskyella sp.]